MCHLLQHRNFDSFASVVARFEPASLQPMTLVWDIQYSLFDQAVLELRENNFIHTTGSLFDRGTAYGLSILIQQESLQDYIVHKASVSVHGEDSRLAIVVPNVRRLAKDFSDHPEEHLFRHCFTWVEFQLHLKFRPEELLEIGTSFTWKLAMAVQQVLFPYYIAYLLSSPRVSCFTEHCRLFLDAYEHASFVPIAAKYMGAEGLDVLEKFYLVNEANPDRQETKFRFWEICRAIDRIKEWHHSSQQIWEASYDSVHEQALK